VNTSELPVEWKGAFIFVYKTSEIWK